VLRDKIQEEQNSPGREKSFIGAMKDRVRESRQGKVFYQGYEGQNPEIRQGNGAVH